MGSGSLLIALCMALTVAFVAAEDDNWTTEKQQHWSFQCPENEFMWFVKSQFEGSYWDRIFEFRCRKPFKNAKASSCGWTGQLNAFGIAMAANCPVDKALAGIKSQFQAGLKDRIYFFYCCAITGRVFNTCELSDWINDFKGVMGYKAPKKAVMTGMYSSFSNTFRDRSFKFTYCKVPKKKLPARFTN